MAKAEEQSRKRKSKTQPCKADGQQAKNGPVIRIVQIFSPVMVYADEANFCSLVQQHTGLHSTIPMLTSDEAPITERAQISSLETNSSDDKPLNTSTFSDSLSDRVSQVSALMAADDKQASPSGAGDVCVRLDMSSDASHSDELGTTTNTDLQDVSRAILGAIPELSCSTEQVELLPSYLRDTVSPTTRDALQDEALSVIHDNPLFWSPLEDETLQTFYDISFSGDYDNSTDQTTTQQSQQVYQ